MECPMRLNTGGLLLGWYIDFHLACLINDAVYATTHSIAVVAEMWHGAHHPACMPTRVWSSLAWADWLKEERQQPQTDCMGSDKPLRSSRAYRLHVEWVKCSTTEFLINSCQSALRNLLLQQSTQGSALTTMAAGKLIETLFIDRFSFYSLPNSVYFQCTRYISSLRCLTLIR